MSLRQLRLLKPNIAAAAFALMAIGLSTGLVTDSSVITPAFTLTWACYGFARRAATLNRSASFRVRRGRLRSVATAGLRNR